MTLASLLLEILAQAAYEACARQETTEVQTLAAVEFLETYTEPETVDELVSPVLSTTVYHLHGPTLIVQGHMVRLRSEADLDAFLAGFGAETADPRTLN